MNHVLLRKHPTMKSERKIYNIYSYIVETIIKINKKKRKRKFCITFFWIMFFISCILRPLSDSFRVPHTKNNSNYCYYLFIITLQKQ